MAFKAIARIGVVLWNFFPWLTFLTIQTCWFWYLIILRVGVTSKTK
jgi:hypothetical protein